MNAVRLAFLLGLTAASVLWSESTPREALLVLSKGDHTLAIVDPSTLKVVAKAPVGQDPHEVVASTDGKVAYVSIYGGGAYNTIDRIDLIGQQRLPSIDLGPLRGPHGLMVVGGETRFTAEEVGKGDGVNPAPWGPRGAPSPAVAPLPPPAPLLVWPAGAALQRRRPTARASRPAVGRRENVVHG